MSTYQVTVVNPLTRKPYIVEVEADTLAGAGARAGDVAGATGDALTPDQRGAEAVLTVAKPVAKRPTF